MFQDRFAAGERLGERLAGHDLDATVVLGIPRGGLPVARPVADALDVPLDVVVASKIGAPRNAELALGAVAADGSAWLNDELIDRLGVEEAYLDREREREAEAASEKERRYRGTEEGPDLDGAVVVLVDDGLATGATAVACLRQVRDAGAERVIFAAPVGSPNAVSRTERDVEEVVCLDVPENFGAVGQFYRSFDQVPDEEALEYLDRESAT
jgi:predicted phosphoribosyltransferase